jgi:hypothetical protein
MDNIKVKLYKPVTVDDKEIKELSIDFENMPSGTSQRATKFLTSRNYIATMPDTDTEVNAMIAGMAAGLSPEDAYTLHDKDKRRLAREAMSFFLDNSEES